MRSKKNSSTTVSWITNFFIIAFIITLVIMRFFVFNMVGVKGSSMDPTLAEGERIISLRHSEIKRFDIVTFPAPDEPKKTYIKRVIGLPGDTIEYKYDVLYINGKAVDEPYLDEYKNKVDDGRPLTLGPEGSKNFSLKELYGVDRVPKGKYLVLGDNRRVSKDGRVIGFIDESKISGNVKFVIWPFTRFGLIPEVKAK